MSFGRGDNIDIRLRLRDAKATQTGLKQTGQAARTLGREVDTAGKRAKGAGRGLGIFRRNQDAMRKSTRLGIGTMQQAARTALRLGIAYAGIGAAKRAVSTTVDLAKATLALHRNLALSEQDASAISAVAKVRGIDTKSLNMSFTALSKAYEKARAGGKTQVQLFKNMGVTQKQLTAAGGDFNQVLRLTAGGLGRMEGGTKRQATAQQLLGRGYQTILPLFKEGTKSFDEQISLANKYGATLSGKPLKNIGDYIALQREMQFAQLGFQVQFTTVIMPALIKFIHVILDLVNAFRKARPEVKLFGAVAAGALLGFSVGGPIGAAVAALVIAGIAIYKNWDKLSGLFRRVKGVVVGAVMTMFTQIKKWLGVNNADLVRFGRAVGNVFKFVVGVLRFVFRIWKWAFMNIGLPILRRFWAGVRDILQGLGKWIGGWIKIIGGLFTGDFHKVWEGIKQVFRGGIQALKGILRAATAPFREIASKVFEGIKAAFKAAINWVIGRWNSIQFKVPGFDPPGPGPKFGGFSIGVPQIPKLALGGNVGVGGAAVVGDAGPELLNVTGRGARVTPLTNPTAVPTMGGSLSDMLEIVVHSVVNMDGRKVAEGVGRHKANREARK